MGCDGWAEAISAMVDGEDPGVDPRLVRAHLARCPACAAHYDTLVAVRRHGLVHEAPELPDLAPRVTKLNAIADRASRWGYLRALLAAIAIEIIVMALPSLVLGHESDASGHAARHLGAFSVAYGVALLLVVHRPARARTVLPVAAVLGGTLAITAVVDLADGRIPLLGETAHLPELLSAALLWLLAVPARSAPPSQSGRRAPLRLADPRQDGPRREAM